MNIIIKTKNLELTPALQVFIEEKIGGLKKFISILKEENDEKGKTLAEVFVEVEKETKHHRNGPYFKAEAKIYLPGKTILSVSEKEDLRQAIVEVKDELQREIKEYKQKAMDKSRRKHRKDKKDILI